MLSRFSHLALCVFAALAYLLNLTAAAGGVVVCDDPHGRLAIEIQCDHGHCTGEVENEDGLAHDSGECWCCACPCKDTSIAVDIQPIRRDDELARAPALTASSAIDAFDASRSAPAVRLQRSGVDPPECNPVLRQHRTVVLII